MKKILLLINASVFMAAAFGQLNKGQWLAGGSAGLSISNKSFSNTQYSTTAKTNNFNLVPGAGYFVMDKLCIGVQAGVASLHNNQATHSSFAGTLFSSSQDVKNTALSVGPFARYYFLRKTSVVNILAEAGCSYNHSNLKNVYASTYSGNPGGVIIGNVQPLNNEYTVNNVQFLADAGPAFFVTPKTSIELTVGYATSKFKQAPGTGNFWIASMGVMMHF